MKDEISLAEQVATEVMGWISVRGFMQERYTKEERYWRVPQSAKERPKSIWIPDKDIVQTWLVVEEMGRRGFNMELYIASEQIKVPPYCRFRHQDDESYTIIGKIEDERVEVAICRAALAAVRRS